MLAEVPEETERVRVPWLVQCAQVSFVEAHTSVLQCFRFNIPKDEDAHMIFVALPPKISWALEDWCINQIKAMVKNRQQDSLPEIFPEKEPADEEIRKEYQSWFEPEVSLRSYCTLKVHKPRAGLLKEQELRWFTPVVLSHVVQSQQQWEAATMLGGYAICFDNEEDEDYVHVAFDMVLVSDNIYDDVQVTAKDHLTPLEEQLGESINAANTILNEMRYMEKRESRMRMTADSIHSKIRLFSYVSVIILFAVTYVQVTYLKRYFQKKKLM